MNNENLSMLNVEELDILLTNVCNAINVFENAYRRTEKDMFSNDYVGALARIQILVFEEIRKRSRDND